MSSADGRQEKAEKAKWFKFTRHGLLVDHSSFTLDHKPGLRSNQISAKAFPWACITPEGKVSKPSPLHNFPMSFYLSGWPPCALASGLSVTETALCSGGGEIKSRCRRQQQTAGDHRVKIKDPSHIFPPCALNKHCNPWNQMLLMYPSRVMISRMWHLAILKHFPISYQMLTVKPEQNTVCRLRRMPDNDITLDPMHFSLNCKWILLYVMCKLILMIKVNNVTLHMRLGFEPFEESPNQLMKFGVESQELH